MIEQPEAALKAVPDGGLFVERTTCHDALLIEVSDSIGTAGCNHEPKVVLRCQLCSKTETKHVPVTNDLWPKLAAGAHVYDRNKAKIGTLGEFKPPAAIRRDVNPPVKEAKRLVRA